MEYHRILPGRIQRFKRYLYNQIIKPSANKKNIDDLKGLQITPGDNAQKILLSPAITPQKTKFCLTTETKILKIKFVNQQM
jgi:hypothetical protein